MKYIFKQYFQKMSEQISLIAAKKTGKFTICNEKRIYLSTNSFKV